MIAITGIGIISPLGFGGKEVIRSFSDSVSGISDAEGLVPLFPGIRRFGQVKGFNPKLYIPAMQSRRMSRFSQFGLSSAIMAVKDSGIEINSYNSFSTGITVGTGLASTDSTDIFYEGLLREGPEGTNPIIFPETVQNIAASHISIHFGIKGPNITFSHSDISSELALFYAQELLNDRQTAAVIVCGADELSTSAAAGYASSGIISEEMAPFDINRKGPVLSEGSASVILEREEDALKRGAHIYCLIKSSAFSSSPSSSVRYDFSRSSMKTAMKTALLGSGIALPDFISASANSSVALDMLESVTIKEVFGSKSGSIPVSAFRSFYGFYNGDGIFRLASAALCIKEGLIPAILGLKTPENWTGLDYVTDRARRVKIKNALINSFSAGGSASSVVIGRHE